MGTTDSNDYEGRHRPGAERKGGTLLAAAMRHVCTVRDASAVANLYDHKPRHSAEFRDEVAR